MRASKSFGSMDSQRRDSIPRAVTEPGVETESLAGACPAPLGTTIHQHPGQLVQHSVSEISGPGDHIPAMCTLAHLQEHPSAVCPRCRFCHVVQARLCPPDIKHCPRKSARSGVPMPFLKVAIKRPREGLPEPQN